MPPLQVTKLSLWRFPPTRIKIFHYFHPYFSFARSALKWYRKNENIQVEVEEMQEEQRSLSSIESVSVWGLLIDRSVRWQVITIAVVNIGMQLSGIDAVGQKSVCVCVLLHVCKHTAVISTAGVRHPSASIYLCTRISVSAGGNRSVPHYFPAFSVRAPQLEPWTTFTFTF